ncbi:MAG: T9SS type A sorting domain-containing protein [Candidatus Cloacimonetes bacterium]|nr:T9SS type A sorting domain-containing protein [Candidatus Cloacimonadota bacterium]
MKKYIILFVFILTMLSVSADELISLGQIVNPYDSGHYYNILSYTAAYNHGGDINNDGFDDYITRVFDSNAQEVNYVVYYGGTSEPTSPDVLITGYDGPSLLQWQGDLNSDGFYDILFQSSPDWYMSFAKVLLMDSEQDFSSPITISIYGYPHFTCMTSGDLNGDGYDDIVVSNPDSPIDDCIWVVYGGDSMDFTPNLICTEVPATNMIIGVYISIGDYNGDGIQDLAMSHTEVYYNYFSSSLDVYCGGDEFGTISTAFIRPSGYNSFDSSGDFNGDGCSDFCGSTNGNLFFMMGADDLFFDLVYLPLPQGNENVRASAMFYCNINNDEYDDVVAKVADEALIYLGGAQIPADPAYIIPIPQDSLGTDTGLGMDLGDFNGDGYNDILISDGLAGNSATIYTLNLNSVDEQVQHVVVDINNYPNPFTTCTTFRVNTKEPLHNARVEIFNIKGQMVKQIPINSPDVTWNGDNEKGQTVSSGIYFYKVVSDGFVSSLNKMLHVK